MSEERFLNRQIVRTEDGSSSIFLPELNEHYHSHHGAVQESQHVFMKMGWEVAIKEKASIDILEVGFGTGLNAWLVYEEAKKNDAIKVHYTSIEAYPVSLEMAGALNYCSPERQSQFLGLHEADWNSDVILSANFHLKKIKTTLADFSPAIYDLVFFDAFSPRSQPELWTKEVFQKMHNCMKPGGILVTYCAKGEVRRNMQAAGFTVEKLPGPPGKREMLRAQVRVPVLRSSRT